MNPLTELLAQGKSSQTEFKSEHVKPEDLAREIVALLNFMGGKILLGVEDDGTVSGVSRPDIEEWVMNVCRNNVSPPLVPLYQKFQVEGKSVVVLDIPAGVAKPYQTQKGDYYLRVGSTSRKAGREELARLFQDSGMVHDETKPIPNTSLTDLDWYRLREYFLNFHPAQLNIEAEEEGMRKRILQNLELLADDNGTVTVLGMLLFGKQPERHLPQSETLFAHFLGEEIGDDILDRKSLTGPVPSMLQDALRVSRLNLQTPAEIEGLTRVDFPVFPEKVLRELLVNAFIHRRWSLMGNVRVFLFSDRLEIISPGRLPNGVTIEKMKNSTHAARNPLLMKFAQDYHFVEKIGRGIPLVLREMKKLGAREPDFVESGEEFKVTLYRKS